MQTDSPLPIKFGKFKGRLDERSRACPRATCRGCSHCRSLPYVRSLLRWSVSEGDRCGLNSLLWELLETNRGFAKSASDTESDTASEADAAYDAADDAAGTRSISAYVGQFFHGLRRDPRATSLNSSSSSCHGSPPR